MNRMLNPFEFLPINRAWTWGIGGLLFSILLSTWTVLGNPIFDEQWATLSCVEKFSAIYPILSSNLLLWLPLSLLLYVTALIFSPSKIRAVDIFATNLYALLPSIILTSIAQVLVGWLVSFSYEPYGMGEIMMRACLCTLPILLSMSMVWSMVWGCYAYAISANMKQMKGIIIFVVCYILVSVVLLVIKSYYSPEIMSMF